MQKAMMMTFRVHQDLIEASDNVFCQLIFYCFLLCLASEIIESGAVVAISAYDDSCLLY
jgi:hypothetical protein